MLRLHEDMTPSENDSVAHIAEFDSQMGEYVGEAAGQGYALQPA